MQQAATNKRMGKVVGIGDEWLPVGVGDNLLQFAHDFMGVVPSNGLVYYVACKGNRLTS